MDEDLTRVLATDLPEMYSRLKSTRLSFRERTVPNLGVHQVFFKDPSGTMTALNFPAKEVPATSTPPVASGENSAVGIGRGERKEDRLCSWTLHLVKQIACHRNRDDGAG